jgi:hypothetical protein
LERPRELIRDGRLLAVVGAGLSARVGYPTFSQYAAALVNDFGVNVDGVPSDDPSAIAGAIKTSLEQDGRLSEFHTHLEQTFEPDGRRAYCDRAHELVVAAGFRSIVTTNYDSVLEDAASAGSARCEHLDLCAPRRFAVFDFLRATAAGRTRAFVLHLHGYFRNPEHVVITTDDYSQRYGPYDETTPRGEHTVRVALNTMHRKVLWTLLVTYPAMFIGFSLRDPAFRHILELIDQDFERGRDLGHYAVIGTVDDDQESRDQEELKRYGITPVFYAVTPSPGAGYPDDHSGLESLLETLSGTPAGATPQRRGEDFTARMLQS